ncbi:MAG: dephospho-CoA kinase [Chitinivibrionia bacterium]|nr:dephospho-CoA kinase [Chitinivibrionia bacterium]
MKVIALVGGTGTGKSTVAAYLGRRGAAVIDADALGHELLDRDPVVRQKILAAFGPNVFRSTGEVDRARLGSVVFNDRQALSGLNDILHPAILDAAGKRIEDYRRANARLVVIDAALLLEVEVPFRIDCIVALRCGREEQARRLEHAGVASDAVRERLRNQANLEKSFHKADFIVDTEKGTDVLFAEMDEILAGVLGEAL